MVPSTFQVITVPIFSEPVTFASFTERNKATPPDAGWPSRSHEPCAMTGPAQRGHEVASLSSSKTRSGAADERAATSYP